MTAEQRERIASFKEVREWSEDDRETLLRLLHSLADEQYRTFHAKLIPGAAHIIGVRMPILRAIAKSIARGDPRGCIRHCRRAAHEETMLEGIVTGLLDGSEQQSIADAEYFLDAITNWALCDCFAGGLRQIQRYPDAFFERAGAWCMSENWWHVRTGLVVQLSWFCGGAYVSAILERCSAAAQRLPPYDGAYTPAYYVRMALAWLIAECWVQCRSEAYAYLTSATCPLDTWTRHKAIQKIRESFRVSPEDKALLARLRGSGQKNLQ